MKHIIQKISAVVLGGLALTAPVRAATIDWGLGAQNISSVNDVGTSGTLVNAFNLGSAGVAATTVNGVTFAPLAFPANYTAFTVTSGNYNFTENVGLLVSYSTLGSSALPYSSLAPEYQSLLSSGGSADQALTLTLTMSGLTVGADYLFQCWVNNAGFINSVNGQPFSTTATAGSSVFIDDNTSNANGGVGRFATGIFTADSAQQTIDFNGASFNDPLINAFQLRLAAPVPEPSTWALFGISALALGFKFHSRKLIA